MIQYVILEYVLSTVISLVIEKYVVDATTRRYVRQMAEGIVREVLREARRRGVSVSDLFSSEGWVVNEIADRISGVLGSVGAPSEDVRESILDSVSSKLKSPATYLSSIAETLSQALSWGGDDEALPDHDFSEKALDNLLEGAEEYVYLASPWVSDPEDLVEEGVRSLKELSDRDLELYLLVAAGENDRKTLLKWAALGFEVREAEGRREGDLGIHCKVYASEKLALGASWNLTVSSLRRLRAMREVHTINPRTDDCDVCNANYELLIREFSSRWSEARQRFFRDEGLKGPAIFEVRWDGDRPTEVVIYRENGERWFTVELDEHHEGFVFNGRAYRYVEEYRGFTALVFDDPDTAAKVIYPFVGLRLERVRPKHLNVVERDVRWEDNAKKYIRQFTGNPYDGALVVWGLDPDSRSDFYVAGGKLLVVRYEESGGSITIEFVDAADPGDLPDWVSGRVDLGWLFDRSSGEGTPTLFVYD
ncbi:hypothetical protein [Methanopyrus kandleri]